MHMRHTDAECKSSAPQQRRTQGTDSDMIQTVFFSKGLSTSNSKAQIFKSPKMRRTPQIALLPLRDDCDISVSSDQALQSSHHQGPFRRPSVVKPSEPLAGILGSPTAHVSARACDWFVHSAPIRRRVVWIVWCLLHSIYTQLLMTVLHDFELYVFASGLAQSRSQISGFESVWAYSGGTT